MYNSRRNTLHNRYFVIQSSDYGEDELADFDNLDAAYDFLRTADWYRELIPIPTSDLDYYPDVIVDAFRVDGYDGCEVRIERHEVYIDFSAYDYEKREVRPRYVFSGDDMWDDPIEDYWSEVEEKRHLERVFESTESIVRNYLPWGFLSADQKRKEPLVLTRNCWYIGVSKILSPIGDDCALYQERCS